MSNQPFGRYTLLRRLAVGGMGELFLAERAGFAGFSKRVVVKCIRPDLADDDEFVEMFLDEGRLAAMITHPNIVQIYELGQVGRQYFMAMEYVPGKNLGEIVDRLGQGVEIPYAVAIMTQLCSALTAAHEAKNASGAPLYLVHRDVSPPNVLVSFSGAVKLTDFGIAKVAMRQRQTRAGVVKGKFAYLSPEQALGHPVDARADVYALGLVLFEATVGKIANPGVVEVEQVYAASQGRVRDPAEELRGYPEELRQIYLRATHVQPAGRYQSAREMQQALVSFAARYEIIRSSSQLAEYLQRLFPREAVEAGEGDFLGDRTRESTALAPGTSEELETLTDGPRGVSSGRGGGSAFGFEGVQASGEVTTEREDDDRTREMNTGLQLDELAHLGQLPGDEEDTLVGIASLATASDDDTLAEGPATLGPRGVHTGELTREIRPREAIRPVGSDALEKAETQPRALEIAKRAERSGRRRSRLQAKGPAGAQQAEKTRMEPWYRSTTTWAAMAFVLLLILAVFLGTLLAGRGEHAPTKEGPHPEARP